MDVASRLRSSTGDANRITGSRADDAFREMASAGIAGAEYEDKRRFHGGSF
jgi:hypothetical protein